MAERLGLLGGTFDPPHLGHLHVAYTALEQLGCDRVVFIPARRQPLKADAAITAPPHRLRMTELLVQGDPRLSVDPIELEREGLSYAVDTVRAYRAAHPAAELLFLMGEDSAATLHRWRESEALAAMARLVVCTRGEVSTVLPAGTPPVERVAMRRIDLSATEIRARVGAGLPLRGFVTEDVATYIGAHGLYRTTTE
ncbi:MAG: hypothetical protein RL139_824 [Gemmatimonadota bacterium]